MASAIRGQAPNTGDPYQDKKIPWVWYPLINYAGPTNSIFRPELKLSFSITPKTSETPSTGLHTAGLYNSSEVGGRGRQQSSQKSGMELRSRSGSLQPFKDRTPRFKSQSPTPRIVELPGGDATSNGYITISGVPVALVEAGYFQIGAEGPHWIFNLTIAFAENLHLLEDSIPAEEEVQDTASPSTGFYFYYNFLGIDIITERFYDLKSPTFPSERISFRIRSSEEDFIQFLRDTDKLIVHICKNGNVIGFAEVNLAYLAEAILMTDDEVDGGKGGDGRISPILAMASPRTKRKSPRVVEEVYSVYNTRQELPISVDARSSNLGISIVIAPDVVADNNELDELHANHEKAQVTSHETMKMDPSKLQSVESLPLLSKNAALEVSAGQSTSGKKTFAKSTDPLIADDGEQHSKTELSKSSSKLSWHQYRFSVDLRSVKGVSPKLGSIYLKYMYAPFGATSPTITYPPVTPAISISSTSIPSELLIPHSFCAFEFVMSPERLNTYLQAVPLIVEVWARDTYEKDHLVGTCTVDFSVILTAQKVTDATVSALSGSFMREVLIQSSEVYNVIISPVNDDDEGDQQVQRIGDLRAILALEDFGVVSEAEITNETLPKVEDTTQTAGTSTVADQFQPSKSNVQSASQAMQSKATFTEIPRSTAALSHPKPLIPDLSHKIQPKTETINAGYPESQAAFELEVWKRSETKKFRAHLRTLESNLLNSLTAEFATRDAARAELLNGKLKELEELESRTKALAIDLEERERKMKRSEEELQRRKEDFEREAEKKFEESRNSARILGEEFKARVEVERIKVTESETAKLKAIQERDELDRRLKALENEYVEFKKKALDGRVVGVSAEGVGEAAVSAVRKELAHVAQLAASTEKRCKELEAAKKHYKSQWIRALRELARLKNNWQMEVKENLAKSNKELDTMKLKLLAKEEIELLTGERKALGEMRRVIEELKSKEDRRHYQKKSTFGADHNETDDGSDDKPAKDHNHRSTLKSSRENMDPRLRAEVERLANERDSLIKSGMYSREDKLIRELDARIHNLLSPAR
jgi:centrosomal protein CEP120